MIPEPKWQDIVATTQAHLPVEPVVKQGSGDVRDRPERYLHVSYDLIFHNCKGLHILV